MAASALLNSIIQLSQYYEEKSPLLYTASLSALSVTSQSSVMASSYKDMVFILRTHSHTQCYLFLSIYFIFLCLIIGSRHCVGAWGTNIFSQRTHPHRYAENGCTDTHKLTQIVMHTNTRKHHGRGVPEPNVISASRRLQPSTHLFAHSASFHSSPHHRHLFHQCVFSYSLH